MKRRRPKDSHERAIKKSKEKAKNFHDRLVLKFLNKLVEVNYEEGDETADEFEKLSHQWNFYCKKFSLNEDAKNIFNVTITNILDRIRANKVTQKLTTAEINLEQVGIAASIKEESHEIATPFR